MRLTVLGNYGPYPTPDGNASGYLIAENDSLLVLDLGSGTLRQLLGETDIRKVHHLYISHLHYDHTADLLPLRYLLEETGHSLTVYVHRESTPYDSLLFNHPLLRVVDIDEHSVIELPAMRLSFLPMRHTVPDYAVRIEGEKTLCYTGDTLYNDNLPLCFQNSDAVLADCSKPAGFHGPHMTVTHAVRLAEAYPQVRLFATHRSADFDPAPCLADYRNITVVQTGESYLL